MSLRAAFLPVHTLCQETRWRIAELLLKDALCVGQLAEILAVPVSTVSDHIKVMHRAGVVEVERHGKLARCHITERCATLLPVLRKSLGISEQHPTLSADAWNAQPVAGGGRSTRDS